MNSAYNDGRVGIPSTKNVLLLYGYLCFALVVVLHDNVVARIFNLGFLWVGPREM